MFEAFENGAEEKFLETVSHDTVWIYHGTQIIPKRIFEGKDRVRKFVNAILSNTEINNTEIITFRPHQYICEQNHVVVLGWEHQKVKRSGKELKQKWLQTYPLKMDDNSNGRIC